MNIISNGLGEHFAAYNLLALPVSDSSKPYVLAASVAQSVPVPAGAKFVMYSANGDFWTQEGVASPVVPAVTPGANTNLELNPDSRVVTEGANEIGLVAAADCIVQVAFYG